MPIHSGLDGSTEGNPLSGGYKFFAPNVAFEVPALEKYYLNRTGSTNHTLEQLVKMMFIAANYRTQHPEFREIYSYDVDMTCLETARDTIHERSTWYIKHLLDCVEKPSDIIQICSDFNKVCDQFLDQWHPLCCETMPTSYIHRVLDWLISRL